MCKWCFHCFSVSVRASITALARIGFGISQAFDSRYQTFSLPFWCCLGLILLSLNASRESRRDILSVVTQAILLAIILVAGFLSPTPLSRARIRGFRLNAAAMALVTGVPDFDQLQWTFWAPAQLPPLVPDMREQHLSIFSEKAVSFLGKPLTSVLSLTPPEACTGHLEPATVIDSAGQRSLKITGWAWDYTHHRPPKIILAVTDGIVTGIGAVGDWRQVDKLTNPAITSNFIGFTGYVTAVSKSSSVEAYAVSNRRNRHAISRRCLLSKNAGPCYCQR